MPASETLQVLPATEKTKVVLITLPIKPVEKIFGLKPSLMGSEVGTQAGKPHPLSCPQGMCPMLR